MSNAELTYAGFQAIVEAQDSGAALQHLLARPPSEVMKACDEIMREAYWKHRDVVVMTMVASTGIAFGLKQADAAATGLDQREMLSWTKMLAYNLGSFTWPGWAEPGVTLTPENMALGLRAAELNLRLAIDLEKPAEKIEAAHWLVGAHLLAAGNASAALEEFGKSLPGEGRPRSELFEGYVHLARLVLKEDRAAADFEAHLSPLQARSDKDAIFIREQLLTARRVFTS